MGNPASYFFSPIKVTDITWNFEKFLVDGQGKPRFRFHPSVEPQQIESFVADLLEERARPYYV